MRPTDSLVAAVTALVHTVENATEQLAAEFEGTRNAVRISGAEYRPAVDGTGAGARVTVSAGRLAGWCLRETTGAAPAVVRLLDGPGGDVVAEIGIPAGQTATTWLLPGGVSIAYGVAVAVVSGAIAGTVYVAGGG